MSKTKKAIIVITVLIALSLLFREYLGSDIECAHGVKVTEETEKIKQAAHKQTILQKIFFTKRKCRKLSEQELKESYRTLNDRPH